MKYLVGTVLVLFAATLASAQSPAPSCKMQASEKKLAGAAQKSFLTKCRKDAKAACEQSAAEKKLAGAAKTSHVKKCVADRVGS